MCDAWLDCLVLILPWLALPCFLLGRNCEARVQAPLWSVYKPMLYTPCAPMLGILTLGLIPAHLVSISPTSVLKAALKQIAIPRYMTV